jgi:arylsulfatase A-like enzyme
VAYIRPHPPFVAPAPYHRLHDPADVELPVRHATVDDEAAVHPFLAAVLATTAFRAHADERTTRQLRATYYGMIAEVDAQFGRLLDAVDADGRGERTVVVVTSDHGEMLGDHWLLGKVGFHRESYHVPLIVRTPAPSPAPIASPPVASPPAAVGAGAVVHQPTEHVDVLPTVLELVGLPPCDQGDGRSLVPLLDGRTRDGWRTDTHWEFDFRPWSRHLRSDARACGLTAQRGERSSYVHFGGLPALYFDRTDDPHELVDRAADPACAAAVLEQAQRMLTWEHTTRDETLARLLVTSDGLVRVDGPRPRR